MASPASSARPYPEPSGPRALPAPGEGPSPEKQLASYQQLVETAHLLLVHGSLKEVLNRVADALQKLIPYDAATIYVADNERRVLQPTLARGAWAEEVMRESMPFGQGLIGWVANHLEPAHVAHDDDDPRLIQIPGTPVEPESVIVMPLVARGTFRGVFSVYREGYVDFSHEEFTLAQVFADQAALAIDSAHAHDALEATARTDSLTGLYNHRFFHEHLRSELNRGHRYRYPVSLVVLDLDDFKGVNDRFGHLEGDAVLHRLGQLLSDELRGNDHACRIGGEEFALILPHTDAQGAYELADRIRHVVRSASFGRAGSLSISAGVASMPGDAHDATALIEAADAALYASKATGKDRVTLYETGLPVVRGAVPRAESRLGELAVLESLAHRVVSLGDPSKIAELIALELRLAIDYHHCRVLLVDESGEWLEPIAESGELFLEGRRRPDLLRVAVGKGITGTAVATGRSLLVDDASSHPDALHLPGTANVEESLLAVPMRYDQRSIGAIVLSKLGLGQFTAADRRLVEILASHAAVAFENAALNAARRRTAERADALLKLVTDAAGRGSLRRRLALLRRALPAEWVVLLEVQADGQLAAVEASGARPSATRALRALELELRLDVAKLTRLSAAETAGLPPALRRERVLRFALDETTVLLAGADSAEGEREMRTTLRELGDRLPPLLGATATAPLRADVAAVPRTAPMRRRVGPISAKLPSGLPRRRLLAMLAEHAVRMTGADGASIVDLDERTNTVRFLFPAGAPMAATDQVSFPAHETLAGEAIREGHVVVVDDYRRHPKAHPHFLKLGLRSAVVVPIAVNGRTVAGIDAYTINRPMRFGASQIAILEVIAQQAGALVSQDKLYEELESSYRATVEALTNALELKDAYTSAHVRQIAELALELGRSFRLGARRLRDLEYAAILHDIGKIGVPTAILNKPGPLTPEERTNVERHTEIGHGLLRDIPFLARVAEIVRSAHERWDGEGYPDGIAGEQIPLEARIIFVCDAWHAMRSDRPYRAALGRDEARRRLADGAGSQFDPKVVEAFLRGEAED